MNSNQHELMSRVATTLRRDIGPKVADDYARTQAFMAAVVLDKLGRQMLLAPEHEVADYRDAEALCHELAPLLAGDQVVESILAAVAAVRSSPGDGAPLSRLVAALYEARGALGEDTFAQALSLVRAVLRKRVDRQMEYSA